MSFTAKLSAVAKAADAILFDGQDVFQWYPNGAGGLLIEYGDDIDFPERITVLDQDITVDDEGQATVQGPDHDAADDIELGLDEPDPTKPFTMDFKVHRPITEGDLK